MVGEYINNRKMAINDLYLKVRDQIFGGNVGKQLALLRAKIEVMEFKKYCEDNGITPNNTQQAYIDKIEKEYSDYEIKILNLLGKKRIQDMEDPPVN